MQNNLELRPNQIEYNKIFVIFLSLTTALGSFFFGFTMAVFNPLESYVAEFVVPSASTLEINLGTSLVPLGAALGAFMAGNLAQQFGRRKAIQMTDVIALTGMIIETIPTIGTILLGRFICGSCVGLNSALVPLYISEYSPVSIKGVTGTFNQILNMTGNMTAFLLGFGIPNQDPSSNNFIQDNWWRIMFLFPAITSSLRFALMTFKYKYETPKYLIQRGRHEEAIQSLEGIYKKPKEQFELLKREIENSGEKKVAFSDLLNPRIKRRFFVGCGLALLQQFTANNAIIFYSKRIFQNETPDSETLPTFYNTIVGFCNFSSAFVAAALIARYGRKTVLLSGNIIVTITLLGYGLITMYSGEQNFLLKYLLFIYSFAFGFSLGPLLWIYVAEILPDKGVAIAVLVNWLFTFAIAQVFPSMLTGLGDGSTLLFFGILSLLGNIFLVKYIKETKNKTDSEIEELFNVNVSDSSLSKPLLNRAS